MSVGQFDSDYQQLYAQADRGDVAAVTQILKRTGSFDGELAFTHEMNLFTIRSGQKIAFSEALLSLDPAEADRVEQSLQQSERTLRLMHH
ncbi:MAG: hypothetical protein V4733_05800 [Verrucomicrobiota bacterium]